MLLGQSALNLIPKNKHFNMTDLIEKVRKEKGNVGVYPIKENPALTQVNGKNIKKQ